MKTNHFLLIIELVIYLSIIALIMPLSVGRCISISSLLLMYGIVNYIRGGIED